MPLTITQEACSPATSPTIVFEPSTVTEAQVVPRNPETDNPVAEIVPAEKFPDASRATIALAVFKLVAVVALFATDKVPPSVRSPEPVTVPVKVIPLTLPVPPTEVTVPLPVPAPIAVLAAAASAAVIRDDPVAVAPTAVLAAAASVAVKRLEPTVVAPKFVLAVAASVAPVPPLAIATVPDTFPAVVAVVAVVAFPNNGPLKLVAVRSGKLV
jgi:hypothetical protein